MNYNNRNEKNRIKQAECNHDLSRVFIEIENFVFNLILFDHIIKTDHFAPEPPTT